MGERLDVSFAPHMAKLADDQFRKSFKSTNWGWGGLPSSTALYLASWLDDEAVDAVADDLLPLLEPNAMQLFQFDTILCLILGRPVPKIPDDPCTLSPGRRKLAEAFMQKPRGEFQDYAFWWKRNGNAGAARARLNLPHDRAVWLKWLGLPRWQIGPFRL